MLDDNPQQKITMSELMVECWRRGVSMGYHTIEEFRWYVAMGYVTKSEFFQVWPGQSLDGPYTEIRYGVKTTHAG